MRADSGQGAVLVRSCVPVGRIVGNRCIHDHGGLCALCISHRTDTAHSFVRRFLCFTNSAEGLHFARPLAHADHASWDAHLGPILSVHFLHADRSQNITRGQVAANRMELQCCSRGSLVPHHRITQYAIFRFVPGFCCSLLLAAHSGVVETALDALEAGSGFATSDASRGVRGHGSGRVRCLHTSHSSATGD